MVHQVKISMIKLSLVISQQSALTSGIAGVLVFPDAQSKSLRRALHYPTTIYS